MSDPFDDPVFQKQAPEKKSAWRSLVDSVTEELGVMGEGAVHALPDTVGFLGDIPNFLQKAASSWHGGSVGVKDIPGMGPASQAVGQSFDKAEEEYTGGKTPRPQNARQRYVNAISRGTADALVLGGPKIAGPSALSGAGGGAGSQAAADIFPDSEWAPLVGGLVGGLTGGIPHVVRGAKTGMLIRAGMSHPDFDVLVNEAILPNEGGGTLTKPKVNLKSGATGPMQVMMATARDPGYGIRPWDGKSQADLARVGRQKFAVLLARYNDPEKALAAYNWGEGNLDKAIRKHGNLWYDHAPEETQKYVYKGMTRVYGGPLKGPEGIDGLPTNGSVPPMDPRTMANIMQDEGMMQALDRDNVIDLDAHRPDPYSGPEWQALNEANRRLEEGTISLEEYEKIRDATLEQHHGVNPFRDLDPREEVNRIIENNRFEQLTPAERQEMDASVPKPVVDNTGYEKFTPNPKERLPVNDTEELVRDKNPPAASSNFGTKEPPPQPPKGPDGHGPSSDKPEGPKAVEKLQNILTSMDELRSVQDQTIREIRKARMSEAGRRANVFTGEAGAAAKMGALKGKLPETKIRSFRKQFGQEELDELFNHVQNHPAIDWQTQLKATTGLQKLLVPRGNLLPTRSELDALHLVFPKELVEGLKKHTSIKEMLINSLNIPRALMASTDFSAPLRQGVFMIGRKEFHTALPDMFKKAFSQKDFEALQNEIASRPTYHMMEEGGLSLTDVTQDLTKREEAFMSNYAEQIPGIGRIVKASDRAYVAFLNKVRADVFDSLAKSYEELKGESLSKNPKGLKDLCEYINAATGRGSLGRFTQSAPFLSTVFFSPRLIASRLQLLNPLFYARLDPFVRKEALKDMFKFAGVALTVLGLAKMGGADVITDPRSTDFGKIKVRDTRFDILGGFQQYIRAFGQIITGQTKNANTGKVTNLPGPGLHLSKGEDQGDYKPTTRKDVAENLILNKFSPVLSFVVDTLRGSNAVGQKPDWSVKGPAKEGYVNWNNPVIQRMIPLVIQDTQDAFKEYGAESKLPYAVAGTGVFGVGTQTYKPIKHEKKSKSKESADPFKDMLAASTSDPFKDEVFK